MQPSQNRAPDNLRSGDVLLFRVVESSNWLDRLIGWGQKIIHQAPSNATYCHAALIGSDASHIFEARWPKIHNVQMDWAKMSKRNKIEVYRVNLTPEQVTKIMDYARLCLGRWYDFLAILTFGLLQLGSTAVCSQFVWDCFTAAGVCLCPYESLESPDDLAASTLLEKVA